MSTTMSAPPALEKPKREAKFWRAKKTPNEDTLIGAFRDRKLAWFSVDGEPGTITGIPNDLHAFEGSRVLHPAKFFTLTIQPFSEGGTILGHYPSEAQKKLGCCIDVENRRATLFAKPHDAILPLHFIANGYGLLSKLDGNGYTRPSKKLELQATVPSLEAALDVCLNEFHRLVHVQRLLDGLCTFFDPGYWVGPFWNLLWLNSVYGEDFPVPVNSTVPLASTLGWGFIQGLLNVTHKYWPDTFDTDPGTFIGLSCLVKSPPPPTPKGQDMSFWQRSAQFYLNELIQANIKEGS